VTFVGNRSPLPCVDPLLYEWRIHQGGALTCLYIGKAKDGQRRPFETYGEVVADLHANRQAAAKLTHPGAPPCVYFKRNPWGFRWIHHQLEVAVYNITRGVTDWRIELRFIETNVPLPSLHSLERKKINLAKQEHVATPGVVVNDTPCMIVRYKRALPGLDPTWI
jgi:hypothetical protein